MRGMSSAVRISAAVFGSGVRECFDYAEGVFSVESTFGMSWAVSWVANVGVVDSAVRWAVTVSGAPMVSLSLVVVSAIVVSAIVG